MGDWLSIYREEDRVKLKNYLVISHLLILIIAVASIFIGLKVNQSYSRHTQVKDDLTVVVEFSKYRNVLDNPELYSGNHSIDVALKEVVHNENVIITLYNPEGVTIYSSRPENEKKVLLETLYSNLNEVTYYYNIYTLKRAVFNEQSNHHL